MRIESFSPEMRNRWDDFVLSHPCSDVGHLVAVLYLEAIASGHLNRSLMIFDDKDNIQISGMI